MINKIKAEIEQTKQTIDRINDRKKGCYICNGFGYTNEVYNNQDINLNMKVQCGCCIESGHYVEDYEKRLQKLSVSHKILTNEIPIEYQAGVFYSELDRRIKDFLLNNKTFLWLHGGTGCGKTRSLFAIIINQIMNSKKYKMKRIKEVDFNYKTNTDGFIALDDVGISNNNFRISNLSELFYEVIDQKLEDREKMIITSNYTIDQWFESIEDQAPMNARRIISRMQSSLDIVDLGMVDWRKLKGGKNE